MQAIDICQFTAPLPPALDDVRTNYMDVDFIISVGTHENPHFITASTTASVELFSFVYLAFLDRNGDAFVIGVSNRTH